MSSHSPDKRNSYFELFKRWLSNAVSAICLLSVFGSNLDLGNIASTIVDSYVVLRNFVWSPITFIVEIDPFLVDLFSFTLVFLLSFLLRGGQSNVIAALCAIGCIAGLVLMSIVIFVVQITGVSELALNAYQWFDEYTAINFPESLGGNDRENYLIGFAIGSCVAFVISSFLVMIISDSFRTIWVALPILMAIASLPGVILTIGGIVYFMTMIFVLCLIFATLYWIFTFFFPHLGSVLHKVLRAISEEQYNDIVVPVLVGYPLIVGIQIGRILRIDSADMAFDTISDDPVRFEESVADWMGFEQTLEYYRPVAEVLSVLGGLVLISWALSQNL